VYPWSVVLHMCEPTCYYCRLLVRSLAHICIVGLPYLSYIYRGRRESFTHLSFLFILVKRCDQEEHTTLPLSLGSSYVLDLSLSLSLSLSLLELLRFLDFLGAF
jgi:hypothetical protein